MNFYTSVKCYGNNVLYRGVRNGKKFQHKIEYKPSLYVPTNEQSEYKTIYGENLKKIKKNSIREAKDFLKQFDGVDNFKVYGNTQYEYCVISELFPDKVEWNIDKIRIAIFDIEVDSNPETGGFASPQNPFQPIISISLKFLNEPKTYLFGYHDYNAPDDVIYIKCKDEYTLHKKFIDVWSYEYPEIVSGWNITGYDIGYLINRFNRIISEQETKKLSPWGLIKEHKSKKYNEKLKSYVEESTYKIVGINILDYMDLYKKYQPGGNSQESYKLDHICSEEINENKVEFEGSLHKLYTEDKDTFYYYNVKDTLLIERLDQKCRLISLALTLAYNSKTNPEDVFQQTRMWDSLIFNFLRVRNIQMPQKVIGVDEDYEGAYVKPTIPGLHKWIVTLDATSLYPSMIMAFGISPETLVQLKDYTQEMWEILNQGVGVEKLLNKKLDLSKLKEMGLSLTPNGQFFRIDRKGYFPEIVEKMFDERQFFKKKMIECQKEYELVKTEMKKRGLNAI